MFKIFLGFIIVVIVNTIVILTYPCILLKILHRGKSCKDQVQIGMMHQLAMNVRLLTVTARIEVGNILPQSCEN